MQEVEKPPCLEDSDRASGNVPSDGPPEVLATIAIKNAERIIDGGDVDRDRAQGMAPAPA